MKFRKHFLRQEAGAEGGAGGTAEPTGQAEQNNVNQAAGSQDGQGAGSHDQNTSNSDQDSGSFDFNSLDPSVQSYIKELRAENAKTRTERNNLNTRMENFEKGFKAMFGEEGEGQEFSPEEQIHALNSNYQDLAFSNAVMGIAYQNQVPHDKLEYFEFLMNREADMLEEGQEMTEEQLAGIIQKVKGEGFNASDANSSVSDNGAGNPEANNSGAVTLETFARMSMVERSELYRKNPNLYNSLYNQAREKRLL
jgi:hypothetical protein